GHACEARSDWRSLPPGCAGVACDIRDSARVHAPTRMPGPDRVVHRRTGPPVAGRIGVFALMDSAERRLRCSTPGPSYYSGRARVTLPYRRAGLLVAAVLAVLASLLAPVTAFAAVANETTLTVTFVDGVTLLSVDRAAVHVSAHQDGALMAEVDGETDAAGISVLINLPHETGEGGVVTLDVTAHKETSLTDSATGCVMNDTWDASRLGVPVDDVALAVAFTADEQQATSSVQCPPDQPAPTGEVGGAV